jgi:hypothetical protein
LKETPRSDSQRVILCNRLDLSGPVILSPLGLPWREETPTAKTARATIANDSEKT